MAAEIPSIEPSAFIAGDTVKWTKSLSDYSPADGWVLTYEFRSQTARKTVTCTTSGPDFLATISAINSAAYPPGEYFVFARVALSGESFTVWEGRITVKRNPAVDSSGVDLRSTARKLLAAVENALMSKCTREEEEYEISTAGGTNRRIRFASTGELLIARDKLRAEVRTEEASERIAQGRASGNRVLMRFNRNT